MFTANNVLDDGAEERGYQEWTEFIKKYTD